MTSPESAKKSGPPVTATHGRPDDLHACGERLSHRLAKGSELLSAACLCGRIWTCPRHGQVYYEVYVG